MLERRFKVEPRLRSFARLITRNFRLKVLFQGKEACIGDEWMQIPPVENTEEGLSRAQYLVAHECSHALYSQLDIKERAAKKDKRLPHILNALEDARTEKLMIRRFEGLEDNMRVNIERIISKWDGDMPIVSQLLGGMFLVGRGFDISMLSDDAQKILRWLEPSIIKASEAPNSQHVLDISEEILGKVEHILRNAPERDTPGISDKTRDAIAESNFERKGMSEFIREHFDEVKLPHDHDGMADMEMLKDENQPEGKTIVQPDEGSIADYSAILAPLLGELNYLAQNLLNLVDRKRQKKRTRAFVRNRERGVVDSRRLWKLCAGREDVFKQRRVDDGRQMAVDPDSLAVYLLVDESHSMMESGRYIRAREAAIIMCEALDILVITFALTGYSVTGSRLQRILYKQFHEAYTDVKTRLLGMRHRLGTLTSEHIPFAVRQLEKRGEKKRILIVVTDATDIESPIRLKNAVLDSRESGIEVIGVGINTSLMSQWYDSFIEITDMDDFARQLLELLRSVLQG